VDFPRSARSSPTRHNRDHHLDFGDRGAAHSERSALRRSLELAAKRCYGNRAHFLQNGFRFGYPQIDWAGNAPGYVGTEFPILPFIAAVCYKLAGCARMDWANSGCHFVRGVGAIFLPARPGDFRQHGGRLGNFLL